MIPRRLLEKLKSLARELDGAPVELVAGVESIVDTVLLILRGKRQVESLKIDVVGTLGRLIGASGKKPTK